MKERTLSIETFNEQLKQWIGQDIKIFKQEIGDDDETWMALKSISYADHTGTVDDYIPKHTLQLHGTGQVENENDELEPLPTSEYEIPIEDSTSYQLDEGKFILTTDRGVYTIERNKSGGAGRD